MINVMLFRDTMEVFKVKEPKKGILAKVVVNKSEEGQAYFVENITID